MNSEGNQINSQKRKLILIHQLALVHVACLVICWWVLRKRRATVDRTDSPMGMPAHSPNANPGTSRKRKNRADDGAYVIKDSLQIVAEAIIKSTSLLVKSLPISEEELYNHLVKLGLEGPKLYESYLFLVRRPDEIRALLGAPVNIRKNMLEFMMSS